MAGRCPAVGLDEVDRLYSPYSMVALALGMSGAALAYLRSTRLGQQALALITGITLSVAVVTVAPTIYWLEHGWVNVMGAVIAGATAVGIICLPLLAALLRLSVSPMGAAYAGERRERL
jgi:uncharacterized membrane protein YjjP (DUF1212 family)